MNKVYCNSNPYGKGALDFNKIADEMSEINQAGRQSYLTGDFTLVESETINPEPWDNLKVSNKNDTN